MSKRRKSPILTKASLDAIQSNLGFSYLHAVVSHAGGSCDSTGRTADCMGIDVTLLFQGQFSSKPTFRNIQIAGQLKSTRQALRVSNGRIAYSLPVEQYHRYTLPSITEFLLFLFVLPEDSAAWLELTPQELILRKCCYWTSLNGAPPSTGKSVTIYLPEKNLFSVEQLRAILGTLSKGERLKYEP